MPDLHKNLEALDPFIEPRTLVSSWLFAPEGQEDTEGNVNAAAIFGAVVEQVEERWNELNFGSWLHVVADCGFKVNVALPADITPRPQPGDIIYGRAIMVGSTGFWDHEENENWL